MNKKVERIIRREPERVVRGILLDLAQMSKENEERIILLYTKY